MAVHLLAFLALLSCVVSEANARAATLKTLYQFPGGGDALVPWGGLTNVGGTLYGTTFAGGAYGRGAVYGINPASGAETLVYSFNGGTDVTVPQVGLLAIGSVLYGVCSSGGTNGYGGVYEINPATGVETVVYNFTPAMGGGSGSSLVYVGGYLYGTTYAGGTGAGYGTVFKLQLATATATILHAFTGGADGASPQNGLVYAKGVLYGAATLGGASNAGTLFAVDATTGAETTLFTFDGAAKGGDPNGGVIDVGGVLYGGAVYGGSNGDGLVFSYNLATRTEKTVYNFTGGQDGNEPQGTLIYVGGVLYGTTFTGGPTQYGTVFSVNATTGAETTLYGFQGGAGGGHSISPLIDIAGVLYGTDAGPETVGLNNGTVFKIVLKTKAETTLHHFTGAGLFGSPGNSDLLDVHATLYGTAAQEGDAQSGTIYTVDPTTGAQTTVYSFTGGADGAVPSGGLAADGNALYGLTLLGGANQDGVIYAIDIASGAETVAYDFPAGGVRPLGDLLLVKGLLYGVTENGGASHCGTVFAFSPAKKTLTTLYTFTCGNDGGLPLSGLTLNGGTLYGTTEIGGATGAGTVFGLDIATKSETVLHSFTGAPDGIYPGATPLYLDGTLYGTTEYGGSQAGACFSGYGCGVLYGLDLATGTYTVLHSFTYTTDGAVPVAALRAAGSTLYGSTGAGGVATAGTLFSYASTTGKLTTLHAFTGGADGSGPEVSLTHLGSSFYGTTIGGAAYNVGTVFSFTP